MLKIGLTSISSLVVLEPDGTLHSSFPDINQAFARLTNITDMLCSSCNSHNVVVVTDNIDVYVYHDRLGVFRIPLHGIVPTQLAVYWPYVRTLNTVESQSEVPQGAYTYTPTTAHSISVQVLDDQGIVHSVTYHATTPARNAIDWSTHQHVESLVFRPLQLPHRIRRLLNTDVLMSKNLTADSIHFMFNGSQQPAGYLSDDYHVYVIYHSPSGTLLTQHCDQLPRDIDPLSVQLLYFHKLIYWQKENVHVVGFLQQHTLHVRVCETGAPLALYAQHHPIAQFALIREPGNMHFGSVQCFCCVALTVDGELLIQTSGMHSGEAETENYVMMHSLAIDKLRMQAIPAETNAHRYDSVKLHAFYSDQSFMSIRTIGITADNKLVVVNMLDHTSTDFHELIRNRYAYTQPVLPLQHPPAVLHQSSVSVSGVDNHSHTIYFIDTHGTVQQLSWHDAQPRITATTHHQAVALAGGMQSVLILHQNGRVSCIDVGDEYGVTDIPSGLEHVEAISAGYFAAYARRADGSVVAWGRNDDRQADFTPYQSSIQAVVGGRHHVVYLHNDGTVGHMGSGSINDGDTFPLSRNDVQMIAGADYRAIAWLRDGRVVDLFDNKIKTIAQSTDIAQLACSRSLYALVDTRGHATIQYRYDLWEQSSDDDDEGYVPFQPVHIDNVAHVASTGDYLFVVLRTGQLRAWYADDQGGFSPQEITIPDTVRCRV